MTQIFVHFQCEIAPNTGPSIDIPLNSKNQYAVSNLPSERQRVQAIIQQKCRPCPIKDCELKQFVQGQI